LEEGNKGLLDLAPQHSGNLGEMPQGCLSAGGDLGATQQDGQIRSQSTDLTNDSQGQREAVAESGEADPLRVFRRDVRCQMLRETGCLSAGLQEPAVASVRIHHTATPPHLTEEAGNDEIAHMRDTYLITRGWLQMRQITKLRQYSRRDQDSLV
jgi:hypothetical protein